MTMLRLTIPLLGALLCLPAATASAAPGTQVTAGAGHGINVDLHRSRARKAKARGMKQVRQRKSIRHKACVRRVPKNNRTNKVRGVPELDPQGTAGALALLLGAVAVREGRRKRKG